MTDGLIAGLARPPGRDLAPLTRVLVRLLWIYFAATVVGAATGVFEQWILAGMAAGDQKARALAELSDLIVGAFGIVETLTYVVAGFVTLKWIYRATLNARKLAPGAEISPGWSIGWYFVPLANLVMPFRFMDRVWRISLAGQAWRSEPTPALLRGWWALWLISGVAGNLGFRLSLRADDIAGYQAAGVAVLISEITTMPLILLLLRIVKSIDAAQAATRSQDVFD